MKIPYEEFTKQQKNNYNSQGTIPKKYLNYFSLKNDGDEAIVRFMYDDPNQFDILDIHTMKNGQWDVKYNCIRDPKEPLDNCPMCKAGIPIQRKFYIKLIQYFNDNGTIKAEARLWERSPSYVATLKSFMSEYSPLSEYIFKVKRVGKAGVKTTQYTIIPCNPSVYTSAIYQKDVSLFENYDVLGTNVADKSWEELQELIPNNQQPSSSQQSQTQPQTQSKPTYYNQQSTPKTEVSSQQEQISRMHPMQEKAPWENQQTQFTPRRY